jgi:uncharacterized repeat protein (TIGR01451 family)
VKSVGIGSRCAVSLGVGFAACVLASTPRAAQLVDADLAVSLAAASDAVVIGQPVSYTATVTDNGPDQASGVSVSVILAGAKGSVSQASAAVPGSACTIAASRRSVRCTLGALPVDTSAQITVVVETSGAGTLEARARARARQYDPIAANSQPQVTTRVTETEAPMVNPISGSAFDRPISPRRSFSIRWSASDAGSGVAAYDVRYRAATATGGFGPYVAWLTGTNERTARFLGDYGVTYCFSMRATDLDGNASPWTGERCVTVTLPPVSLARSRGWTRSGTAGGMRSRTKGSRLTLAGVRARRIVLSALVGPGYGRIRATWNGRPLRTIALGSHGVARRSFTLAEFPSLTRGTLVLTVVSDHETVAVYGLGVAKL